MCGALAIWPTPMWNSQRKCDFLSIYLCLCKCFVFAIVFVAGSVFVFSHHVVNTGVTNVWDVRYLADSVLNSFMCRPILLLLRHIPDNSLSKIEFCLYTLHFSINDYKLVLFLSLSKRVRRWPPLLPSFIVSGSKSCFYPCVNILTTKATSVHHKHQQTCNIRFSHFKMAKLETQNNVFKF